MSPRPRQGVLRTSPYVPGARAIADATQVIKLSANESPLGPSPHALAAYQAASATLFRYPDATQSGLRGAISESYNIDPDLIVCGNGSDEVLSLLIRTYAGPGDEIILSQYCFAMCFTHAHVQGADVVVAPEPNCRVSVQEIVARVTPRTRLVIIANPNNPCGTYLPAAELRRLQTSLPADVLLVLDAAYAEYVSESDYESGIGLVAGAENVFVTHTFSKLYGLAGLRIGWGYGPAEIVGVLHRARTPFNANAAALAAAEAAVLDRQHVTFVREHTQFWRARITEECSKLGLTVVPSVTNFLLIGFPAGPKNAAAAADHLQRRGIIPRPVNAGGPENALRITIGLETDNKAVIAALREFMGTHVHAA